MWKTEGEDVTTGRAIVISVRLARMMRGFRINPVGAVEERGKRRTVHDSTNSYDWRRGRPVNETTYWDQIRECRPSYVVGQIIRSVLALTDKFGKGRRILTQKMVKRSAFR